MASYPNALFDMCGLCCGHFMMPMGSFLLATTMGKGFIKAPLQGLLFVWVFKVPPSLSPFLALPPSLRICPPPSPSLSILSLPPRLRRR